MPDKDEYEETEEIRVLADEIYEFIKEKYGPGKTPAPRKPAEVVSTPELEAALEEHYGPGKRSPIEKLFEVEVKP
jgi:hypothetical protein